MNRYRRAALACWGAALAGILVADWRLNCRHDGSTLSECTRGVYRTDHPAGRAAFLTTLVAATGLYGWHICWPDSYNRAFSRRPGRH